MDGVIMRDYALCRTKKFPEAEADSHLIKPLLRELVHSRWLDIGHVLFVCVFIDLVTEKNLGQYQGLLYG